jgi:GWxTD domain-containing protein
VRIFPSVAILTLAAFALARLGSSEPEKSDFKKWLNEEVVWIISDAEEEEFKSLKDHQSRENFISQFWRERDPTPSTQRNEYKEEHYRRVLFATQMFQEGIPGWKTDRGRIYILHGPPDSQSFYRSRSEISPLRGGAYTDRNPNTILWTYHQLPTAEYYRGEMRLIFQPSSGISRQNFALSESLTAQQKASQLSEMFSPPLTSNSMEADIRYKLVMAGPPSVVNASGAELPTAGIGDQGRYLDDLFRSPGELLEEQKAEMVRREKVRQELNQSVAAQVSFGQLPFQLSHQTFHRPGHEWLVPINAAISMDELSSEKLDVYAAVFDYQGALFDEFVDSVDLSHSAPVAGGGEALQYRNSFSVPSGEYSLKVVLREVPSNRTGLRQTNLKLDGSPPDEIKLGSCLLTNRVELLPESLDEGEPVPATSLGNALIFNQLRLLPNSVREFSNHEHIFLYLQTWVPVGAGEISITAKFIKGGNIFNRLTPKQLKIAESPVLEYGTVIPLRDFPAGEYTLQIQALDHKAKKFDTLRTDFTVYEMPQPPDSPQRHP